MMTPFIQSAVPACPSFEQLRDRSREATEAGRFDEALRLLDRALEVAREEGDDDLVDLAICNRSSVLISLARQDEVKSPLREILMRNRDADNCFLAAYNLSRAQVRDKAYKKGLFYARIARDRALALDRPDWLCSSHNQIGNCLMDESYFEEAAVEYRRALALEPDERSPRHVLLTVNLGNCIMMLGDLERGMEYSFRALRRLRHLGSDHYEIEVWARLDLTYAYLELGRPQRARRHGLRALELAEASGDPDRIKNSLFLLGETERVAGNGEVAHQHFRHLQRRFFPQSPQIVDLMVAVEMRQVVNLRA